MENGWERRQTVTKTFVLWKISSAGKPWPIPTSVNKDYKAKWQTLYGSQGINDPRLQQHLLGISFSEGDLSMTWSKIEDILINRGVTIFPVMAWMRIWESPSTWMWVQALKISWVDGELPEFWFGRREKRMVERYMLEVITVLAAVARVRPARAMIKRR